MTAGPLSVGFVLSHEQFLSTDLVEIGVAAERAGFDALWASDHFHPWQDNQGHAGHAWITLAALTQRTTHITMGTGVTCPTFRFHPSGVAHAFASLSILSPGRVFLGVGTGEALNEVACGGGWGPYRERADRLTEAVELIRRLWTEEWVSTDGPYYPVTAANLYDKPPQQIPIYIAGHGPKSAALAGSLGDGWVTDTGTLRLPGREPVRAAFDNGWRTGAPGRGAPRVLVEQFTVVGDEDMALESAQFWQFMPVANEVIAESDPRAIQRHAEATSSPERAIQGWLISTDPADHIDRIHALHAAGATDVYIHAPQPDQEQVISFYEKSVLPEL